MCLCLLCAFLGTKNKMYMCENIAPIVSFLYFLFRIYSQIKNGKVWRCGWNLCVFYYISHANCQISQFLSMFFNKLLAIWILFRNFTIAILRIAFNEMLALICRLALFYENGVYCVLLLISWKLGTFNKRISERNKVDAYTLRVYTWHKCALSLWEGAFCAIHIYIFGVGFCTFSFGF